MAFITESGKYVETTIIDWTTISEKDLQKTKDQLLACLELCIYNNYIFELYSKEKFTDNMKDWLKSNNIVFFED